VTTHSKHAQRNHLILHTLYYYTSCIIGMRLWLISNALDEKIKKKIKLKFLNYIILASRDVSGFDTFRSKLSRVRLPWSTRLCGRVCEFMFFSFVLHRELKKNRIFEFLEKIWFCLVFDWQRKGFNTSDRGDRLEIIIWNKLYAPMIYSTKWCLTYIISPEIIFQKVFHFVRISCTHFLTLRYIMRVYIYIYYCTALYFSVDCRTHAQYQNKPINNILTSHFEQKYNIRTVVC